MKPSEKKYHVESYAGRPFEVPGGQWEKRRIMAIYDRDHGLIVALAPEGVAEDLAGFLNAATEAADPR